MCDPGPWGAAASRPARRVGSVCGPSAITLLLVVGMVLFLPVPLLAGRQQLDSLRTALEGHPLPNSERLALLLQAAEEGMDLDHEEAYRFAEEARGLAGALQDSAALARALTLIARERGLYMNDKFTAVKLWLQAVTIAERARDTLPLAVAYIDLGGMYTTMRNDTLAEKYLSKGIELAGAIEDDGLVVSALYSLALVRCIQGRCPEGIQLNKAGERLARSLHDDHSAATHLLAIGVAYDALGQLDSALRYMDASTVLFERAGDQRYLSYTYAHMALLRNELKDNATALALAECALEIGQRYGLRKELQDIYLVLATIHEGRAEWRQAYLFYREYDALQDEATNTEEAESSGRVQAEYAYAKQEEAEQARRAAQEMLDEADRRRQGTVLIVLTALALGTGVVSFTVYRSLQRTRRSKEVIERQKRIVEEKQREIIASITYSKRLQDAILPSRERIDTYFPECFVLYLPKDIVAGDFYWLKQVEHTLFVAVADCTGHGVPGALVSVVCATALEQAVREFKLNDPGQVLDKATDLVLEVFEQHGAEVKDGMDISLLAIDMRDRSVRWSGANLPLYYVSSGVGPGSPLILSKVDPDRQPVGRFGIRRPFSTVHLTLVPGTAVYLFSDGYADQFGGSNDKKFMLKTFQRLLVECANLDMRRQGEILRTTLEEWRQGREQTDDITVMGIRL